jgi:hypothetical protein
LADANAERPAAVFRDIAAALIPVAATQAARLAAREPANLLGLPMKPIPAAKSRTTMRFRGGDGSMVELGVSFQLRSRNHGS